jgi:hypothetical protein
MNFNATERVYVPRGGALSKDPKSLLAFEFFALSAGGCMRHGIFNKQA